MCGIIGVISKDDRPDLGALISHGLYQIQNRGDFSAGIATIKRLDFKRQDYRRLRRLAVEHVSEDFNSLMIAKGLGKVTNVFDEEKLNMLKGFMGIGHVRYPTAGYTLLTPEQEKHSPEERKLMEWESIQPLRTKDYAKIAMVHNGDVHNYEEVMSHFSEQGLRRATNNDLEAILTLFAEKFFDISENVNDSVRVASSVKGVMENVKGTYSVLSVINNVGLVAFRDPNGRRPLFFGVNKTDDEITDYAFASETVALEKMLFKGTLDTRYVTGQRAYDEVKPGEMIFISKDFVMTRIQVAPSDPKVCPFDSIYFMRGFSFYNNRRAKTIRADDTIKLWNLLTTQNPEVYQWLLADRDNTIICPVPNTANTAALALANYTGFELAFAIEKHPDSPRIFIQPTQKHRERQTIANHCIYPEEVYEKNVILIDDSIVRGTTLMHDVKYLKDVGAKSVHLMIMFPPIIKPCMDAMDFHSEKELFAYNKDLPMMKSALGLGEKDSLTYITAEILSESTGISLDQMCTKCYR